MGTKLIGRNELQAIIDPAGLKLNKMQPALSSMAFPETVRYLITFLWGPLDLTIR